MQAAPKRQLVADELEAESKTRLRTSRELQEEYEAERDADRRIVDEKNTRREPCAGDRLRLAVTQRQDSKS